MTIPPPKAPGGHAAGTPKPSDETDDMPPLHHDGRLRLAAMPKVELHVHLEGSIRPETLMALSAKNGVDLPPKTLDEFREWFRFVDFPHFAEVYQAMSKCIRTPEDLETITRDFLAGQAAQNILHSEATFTALTHYRNAGIPFDEQIDAIDRAREWAKKRHGVSLLLIVDIPREFATPQEAMMTAGWVADAHGKGGVAALGLGGYENGFPPEMFADAFALAAEAGVPAVVHAGETGGPESVRGAVESLGAIRVGHGVRAMEDPDVVDMLRERGTILEVCPSSNVCLKVYETMAAHPLPKMLEAGLAVTLNTDDPPFFNTTLTEEYVRVAETFGIAEDRFRTFNLRAARASLLPDADKVHLADRLSGA